MELEIQHRPGGVRVIVQGPEGSAELRQVLDLLQSGADRLWLLDDRQQTVSVFPQDILWAETVDDRTFVYTAEGIYRAPFSLTALELRWGALGLFRCGKSTVVNLNAVRRLYSRPGGRIEAVLPTGEKIIISRRYAPDLRAKLQGGDSL
ncbi:MAG: LytTR family transcriptional regulator [Subdoligranulum variabile]|nr:MAG: LytTR family transcriptional regulator [Subdoligranulum variabile]